MIYESWPSPVRVAPHRRVRCCWSLRGDPDDGADEPALPDGCPELLFNFGAPFAHIDAAGHERLQPAVYLVGPITAPFRVRPTGPVDLLAVRLEPHGAYGLVDDLEALRDAWVDGRDLADDSLLALHATLAPQDDAARRATLGDWLHTFVQRAPLADPRVIALVQAIVADGGANAVGALAVALDGTRGTTTRTLQRLFRRQVGVPPKLLARIVRFHHTCVAWREAPHTLARVAAAQGYADESHLVRDFRRFVGEPPAAFLDAVAPFTANFLHHVHPGSTP